VRNKHVILWIKTLNGKVVKIKKRYKPDFYVPLNSVENLSFSLSDDCDIRFELVEKKIFPNGKSKFLHFIFEDVSSYNTALEIFEKKGIEVYNSDLLHSQRFVFNNDITPLSLVNVENGNIEVVDDFSSVDPPKLKIGYLMLYYAGIADKPERTKLLGFTLKVSDFEESVEGDEEYVLSELEKLLSRYDPDVVLIGMDVDDFYNIIYTKVLHYRKFYRLGRKRVRLDNLRNPIFMSNGRLFFNYQTIEEIGLAGLQERCLFSMLPPRIAYRWTAGRLVDSRQCYLLYKDYAIPRSENVNLNLRTAWDIFLYDKGGMLQSPLVGLHENVAVLDFESMFPNIIVRYNVSYETVSLDKVKKKPRGLLVKIVEPFLKRRLFFKHLKHRVEEPYRTWANQRQNELKLLLVSSYGYSGNNFNRFGNSLTFEWINRISREVMAKVYDIARKEGYSIVYSDTDSIFVKKKDASLEDFKRLANKIEKSTKLPIKVDRVYRFLVLLPMKTDPNLGGTKRYYGRLTDGSLDFKGVEVRRHDYPEYIKHFQVRLVDILLSGDSVKDIDPNVSKCFRLVAEAIDELMERRVPVEKLVVRKILRRSEYRVLAPHYIAALQLRMNGYRLGLGDVVEFVYINSRSRNPLGRVQAWRIYDGRGYDVEKYVQLLLDAAESILAVFGFNRARFYESEKDYFDEVFEKYLIEKLDF